MTQATLWKWLAGLAVAALIGYFLLPSAIDVETGQVELRPFHEAVEVQGRTRAINPYVVTAPVAGRLLRAELTEGDRVTDGQVLARIAPAPQDPRTLQYLRANVTAAEARLAAAVATREEIEGRLQQATRDLERREELLRNGSASVEETETYRQIVTTEQARLRSAEATLRAIEAEAGSARSFLIGTDVSESAADAAHLPLRSPVDGTVYQVFEKNERVIAAGTPLLEISNGDRIEVIADILTQDAVAIDPGDVAYITGWGGDQALNAVVRTIEPEAFTKVSALGVEEQRVNIILELLEPPTNLGAEYRVQVAIVTWQANAALTIPTSAIFQRNDGWNTFVVNDNRVETRPVLIGQRGGDHTRVIGGIEEGERVILYPSDLITEGAKVIY